jgi:hypothetical protein
MASLLGLVMVGPHVTDLVEAGVSRSTPRRRWRTVADGMCASDAAEAIKEAGLVALGRPIHIPIRKRPRRLRSAFVNPPYPRLAVGALANHGDSQCGRGGRREIPVSETRAEGTAPQEAVDAAFRFSTGSTSPRSTSTRSPCWANSAGCRGRHPADLPERVRGFQARRAARKAHKLADQDRAQRLPDALAPVEPPAAGGPTRAGPERSRSTASGRRSTSGPDRAREAAVQPARRRS